MAARLVNIAFGVWLLFSPDLLLGYEGPARISHLIVGPLIATTATIAVSQVTRELRWVNLLLGAWLVVSVVFIPHAPVALANGVAIGLATTLLSVVGGSRPHQQGGGWPAVLRPLAHDDPEIKADGGER